MHLPTTLPLLFLLLPLTTLAKPQPKNSVLLSKIQTLTLRSSAQTSSRRVPSIPQLTCVGGNAKDLYSIDVLRCRNAGSDYDDEEVQWTCQASLPPEFKLGSTDVICEGYENAQDPYVLKGSCGVEYRLVLTEAGEERYGRRREKEEIGIGFWVCLAFIAAVFGFGIWQSCTGRGGGGRVGRGAGGWGGGWGGGGGDDDDNNDPPPPYTPRAPKWARSQQQQQANQQWRPGFWTGTAAGAAAGYLAGNRNTTRQADPQVGSSRWANRGGGGGRSSSPQPSSSRYESTGFGGTTRR